MGMAKTQERSVKINKEKAHENGAGRPEGGALMPYYSSPVADPNKERLNLSSPIT